MPSFIAQTTHVQGGFWIGEVGVDTPANYLTNFFYYLENSFTRGWAALFMIAIVALTVTLIPKVYKKINARERKSYLLVASIAFVAPAILFVLSMPPLSSVFVVRYLLPSLVFVSIFLAVVLVVGTKKWRPIYRAIPILLVVAMSIFGIQNVYWYGNYNKNSHAHIQVKEVIELIRDKAPVGTPIVANSPWVYYEASFYSTPDYPVYFIDEATTYDYGSLAMLRDKDIGKIKDLQAFKKQHRNIWYIGSVSNENGGHVKGYQESWMPNETVSAYSYITNKSSYGATSYTFSAE